MSRIGRLPIAVPKGVTVKIAGGQVAVKGPKGELTRDFGNAITVKQENDFLIVARNNDSQEARARHGLSRALLASMVEGVNKGFEKTLEIVGVGFRAQKTGDKVTLNVGYSHPVEVSPMTGVTLTVEGTTKVKVIGIDKELVGLMASKIVAIKPHDDYKGKGLRYAGVPVRLKAGKAGKAIGRK
jgi:large subunit ribosomal protein L6